MTTERLWTLLILLAIGREGSGHAWVQRAPAPAGLTPRTALAMAYDSGRGRIVMFGGWGANPNDDTWEYDGTSWTQGPAAPPTLYPRAYHAMSYDVARGRTVLTCGYNGNQFKDTWEYDGSAWTAGPDVGSMTRDNHGMAYDANRQRTVLFGGYRVNGVANDTWEYDGIAWTLGPVTPAGLTPRQGMGMAYDPARKVIVLFSGGDAGNIPIDSATWEYDGVSWTLGPSAPAELTGRTMGRMAYDAELGRIVLLGGLMQGGWPTWEYDGTAWTPGSPTPAPLSAREREAMAYHAALGQLIVFGGDCPTSPCSGVYNDTWGYTVGLPDYVAGAGLGFPNPNRVRVLDSAGSPTPVDFLAYGAGQWGTNVAAADVDGGNVDELLTGPGPGAVYGPNVRGFKRDGTPMGKIAFYAYGTLKYGVNVSAGRLDGDNYDEIVTGAGPGEVFGPHVRGFNFDGSSVAAMTGVSFFAYGTLKLGVNVARGDVDADGFAEILTGPGPGAAFAPLVRGWNIDGGPWSAISKISFWAFSVLQYGADVGGGDADADGFDEIVAAPGPGASLPSRFRGYDYDGVSVSQAPGYDVTPFVTGYGGRLGLGYGDVSARELLLAAAGRDPAADSTVRPQIYSGSALIPYPVPFVAMAGTAYGVNLSYGTLAY